MTATPPTTLQLLSALLGPSLATVLEGIAPPPAPTEADRVVKSPNHEEGFQEGYEVGFDDGLLESVDRTLNVIATFPDFTIDDLKDILIGVRETLTNADEEEAAVGTDPELDALRAIFGPHVHIVRLEQASR